MQYAWVIGVVLATFASVVSNLGLNLQKLTHKKIESESESVKNNYWTHRTWVIGLGLIILGSVADFVALGFGAQSIIAPLGSLTLVANVFFAPLLLNEKLTRRDVTYTFIIVGGSGLSVAFASHDNNIYSIDELFSFFTKPRFGVYAVVICVFLAVLWLAAKHCHNLLAINDMAEYEKWRLFHRFSYAAMAGTVGAQSVLFAKCLAELVVNTISGDGVLFAYYPTYLVIIFMCLTIFLQIKWLNQGLALFDALYIVPVFQSFWILVGVVSGLIFFGEYNHMDPHSSYLFPIGVLMTIFGVYALSQRGVSSGDDDGPMDSDTPLLGSPVSSPGTPQNLMRRPSRSHEIDETLGYRGRGPPAAFTPSMMGRAAMVYHSVPSPSKHGAVEVNQYTFRDSQRYDRAATDSPEPLDLEATTALYPPPLDLRFDLSSSKPRSHS